MTLSELIDTLIHKIFRFINSAHHEEIRQLILKTDLRDISKLADAIVSISVKILKYSHIKQNSNRQDFIVDKILRFLKINYLHLGIRLNEHLVVADIGGGNGNVLSGLNYVIRGPRENYMCVEDGNWVEKYTYNNKNIIYKFWDNFVVDIADNSCDIVLCMVSLHHMTSEVIDNTLREIKRILKPNGILLIKEHNTMPHSFKLIEWEHHLYHILDCAYNKQITDAKLYLEKNILNCHNYVYWEQQIREICGLSLFCRTDRFLEGPYYDFDRKNPTSLYWDIYKYST